MRFILALCFSTLVTVSLVFSKPLKKETIVLTKSNSVVFDQEFRYGYLMKVIDHINMLDSLLPPGEPIYMVMITLGGEVISGDIFISHLQNLDRPIHTITYMAASMGFITVQSLGKRYLAPGGALMSHQASGGVNGTFDGNIESRHKWIRSVIDKFEKQSSSRMKLPLDKYKALIKDELWINEANIEEYDAVDAIAIVRCVKEENDRKSTPLNDFVFGARRGYLPLSYCPFK